MSWSWYPMRAGACRRRRSAALPQARRAHRWQCRARERGDRAGASDLLGPRRGARGPHLRRERRARLGRAVHLHTSRCRGRERLREVLAGCHRSAGEPSGELRILAVDDDQTLRGSGVVAWRTGRRVPSAGTPCRSRIEACRDRCVVPRAQDQTTSGSPSRLREFPRPRGGLAARPRALLAPESRFEPGMCGEGVRVAHPAGSDGAAHVGRAGGCPAMVSTSWTSGAVAAAVIQHSIATRFRLEVHGTDTLLKALFPMPLGPGSHRLWCGAARLRHGFGPCRQVRSRPPHPLLLASCACREHAYRRPSAFRSAVE